MSQSANPETIKDLIGVGFGPSNLALAIALEELAESQGHALDAQFIDKQQDYRWHGETLATQSELQISFLKDLVSLRNPTSPYSFVNYLHQKQRLADFINLGTFYLAAWSTTTTCAGPPNTSPPRPCMARKCCVSNRNCRMAG